MGVEPAAVGVYGRHTIGCRPTVTMIIRARMPALTLCLVVCADFLDVDCRVAAFNLAPYPEAYPRSRHVQTQRPSWPCRRASRVSSPAGGLRLSAVEDGEEKADDTEGPDGVYVATEALLDDPSHMERILASMTKLAPRVEPLEGIFKSAVSHHCALRTANIVRAMKFYSLLGMKEVVRFKAESARCAFLEGAGMRLELIEVPPSMKPDDKASDLAADMRSTGLNHIAFDVGPAIEAGAGDGDGEEEEEGLKGFLSELNRQSEDAFGMSVRLVVSPYEQRIGQDIFDLAFIMDADGVLLELVHKKDTLAVDMPQAW